MSLSIPLVPASAGAAGAAAVPGAVAAGAGVTGAADEKIVCSPAPFWSFSRKPSFSISKTDKSFFLIKSMIALMSFSSKVLAPVVEAGRLGNAVFRGRSSVRDRTRIPNNLSVAHFDAAGGGPRDFGAVGHHDQGGQRFGADPFQQLHDRGGGM